MTEYSTESLLSAGLGGMPGATRLRGVSLLYEAPPLGRFHLSLSPGLHVLYGLNGAGKTNVLRVLMAGLGHDQGSGRGTPVVHLERSATNSAWTRLDQRINALILRLHDTLVSRTGLDVDAAPLVDRSTTMVRDLLVVEGLAAEVAAEVAQQRVFVITRAGPAAILHVGVRFDGPCLSRLLTDVEPAPIEWAEADLYRPSVQYDDEAPPLVTTGTPAYNTLDRVFDSTLDAQTQVEGHFLLDDEDVVSLGLGWLGLNLRMAWDTSRREPQAPVWVSWPLLQLGVLYPKYSALADDLPVVSEASDTRDEVRALLSRLPWEDQYTVIEGRIAPVPIVSSVLAMLDTVANGVAGRCLAEAPVVVSELRIPDASSASAPLVISALDQRTAEVVPREALSTAEQRWADMGIRVGVAALHSQFMAVPSPPATDPEVEVLQRWMGQWADPDRVAEEPVGVVVMDEPDAALHPSARSQVAAGLSWLAEQSSAAVVVAAHAPEFLDAPNATLWHVRRDPRQDGGIASLLPLPEDDLRTTAGLSSLGLTRADWLQRFRLWVVVEGEHDEAVVETLLGDDYLQPARARVLVLDGTHNLWSIVDSQVIFDGSDADILIVLDNTRDYLVRSWQSVRALAPQDTAKAHAELDAVARRQDKLKLPDGSEERRLLTMLRAIVRRGCTDRVHVFGLHERDVLQYLPASAFVPAAQSWEDLVQQWKRAGRPADFKKWLRSEKQAKINTKRVREAAEALDSVPAEFVRLGDHILEASRRTYRSPAISS